MSGADRPIAAIGRVELAATDQQQPEDRRHALVPDRRHQLAVRADDGVDSGAREPADTGPVGLETGDEIGVDRDELVRGVDVANHRT